MNRIKTNPHRSQPVVGNAYEKLILSHAHLYSQPQVGNNTILIGQGLTSISSIINTNKLTTSINYEGNITQNRFKSILIIRK